MATRAPMRGSGRRLALLSAVVAIGCSGGDGAASDAAAPAQVDAAGSIDSGNGDGGATGADGGESGDAAAAADAMAQLDGSSVADAAPTADANTALDEHVHIYIDNFCNTSVDPPSFTVPAGSTISLRYHNHSVDYEADVWLSYGGGYLELARGGTWNDAFVHCSGPNPYTAYADISIAGGGGSACPGVRLYIDCQ